MTVNKVLLIGNLGRDPEMRYAPSGDAVCNVNIATTEKWKDKSGEMKEATEWHRVVFWGKLAEICAQYLTKGSQVYVEGKIQTKKYTDKDGAEKYSTEIKGDVMKMLGSKSARNESGDEGPARKETSQAKAQQEPLPGAFDEMSDDIPF